MSSVVRKLLDSGSDPNLQTPPPSLSSPVQLAKVLDESSNPFGDDEVDEQVAESIHDSGLLSSIHLAVHGGYEDVVMAFVEHAEYEIP